MLMTVFGKRSTWGTARLGKSRDGEKKRDSKWVKMGKELLWRGL